MSNEEFNPEELKFIGEDTSPLLDKDAFNDILGVEEEKPVTTAKFVPPAQKRTFDSEKVADKVSANQTPEKESIVTEERVRALEEMIMKLRDGMGGVQVTATANPIKLDFSKLTEADVFDLSIAMETIEHYVPDITKIDLKDPNYVARWVSTHIQRLGPMKQAGFTYITPEDLGSPLEMDLQVDENGIYKYIDVVAMKTLKDKYFRALRMNYLRALAQTQRSKVHELARSVTEQAMMNGTGADKASMGQGAEYQKRKAAGHIGIYSPNIG